MKRVLLTISYDGTSYHGWQVQQNALTVQQVLQNALEKLLGVRPAVTGCSRTDSGVHAREFCCHLDCDDALPPEAFLRGLNSILPSDIAVIGCRTVSEDFHARYRAAGKNYVYQMYVSERNDPFRSRYALRLDRTPDLERMNAFCKTILGKHDFAAFSSAGGSVEDTVRTVTECCVYEQDDMICLSVSADGFLYNMVRIIVGTSLAVSDGRRPQDIALRMFETNDRSLGGETAPPQGLFLNHVFYREDC